MFKKIDFSPGKVIWNHFDFDPSLPLNDNNFFLTEDMLFVTYPKNLRIDVSWINGIKKFIVVVIQGDEAEDWDTPLFEKRCKNLKELEAALLEYTGIIRTMLAKGK